MPFFTKLETAISQNSSLLVVGLDPNPEMMPTHYGDRCQPDALIQGLRDWLPAQHSRPYSSHSRR